MDRQSVFSLSVLPPDVDATQNSRSQIQSQLREFILEFRLDNAFIYRFASDGFWGSRRDIPNRTIETSSAKTRL